MNSRTKKSVYALVAAYLLVSFITWTWNPAYWNEAIRAVSILIAGAVFALSMLEEF